LNRLPRLLVGECPVLCSLALAPQLAASGRVDLVAAVRDAEGLLRCASTIAADLVLLDMNTLRGAGPDTVKALKQTRGGLQVLVLCSDISRPTLRAVLHAGADGYIVQLDCFADLLVQTGVIANGGSYFSDDIAQAFRAPDLDDSTYTVNNPGRWELEGLSTYAGASQPAGEAAQVTQRETEILSMVAVGYNSKGIADRLCISVPTVRKHRENLMRKLGLHSTAAVTAYAIAHGLLTRD
jgi:DNA-binding NarL/FixJ family response regulator